MVSVLQHWVVSVQAGVTMGCIKSKEEKGPTMKYRPENSMMADPNAAAAAASQTGHYGPDPTQPQQSQVPSSSSGNVGVNFNHSITPFGGSSSAMTPFGGVSSSFTGPVSNSFSGAVSSEFSFHVLALKCTLGFSLMILIFLILQW